MPVIKIPVSDMPASRRGKYLRRGGPEYEAVKTLEAGEAIKFPCRWNHSKNGNQCSGVAQMFGVAKMMGVQVKAICRDAWVYVHVVGILDTDSYRDHKKNMARRQEILSGVDDAKA
jgi:hypothetical protein